MNRFGTILTLTIIVIGVLLIMFVLKIIWLSSNSMGMMVDKDLIYDHMQAWIKAIIIISILMLFFFLSGIKKD